MESNQTARPLVTRQDLLDRLRRWRQRPSQMNHRIVDRVMRADNGVVIDDLINFADVECQSLDPEGLVRSLMHSTGNNSGRIFEQQGAIVVIDPVLMPEARDIWMS